jgi:hypothetical protein
MVVFGSTMDGTWNEFSKPLAYDFLFLPTLHEIAAWLAGAGGASHTFEYGKYAPPEAPLAAFVAIGEGRSPQVEVEFTGLTASRRTASGIDRSTHRFTFADPPEPGGYTFWLNADGVWERAAGASINLPLIETDPTDIDPVALRGKLVRDLVSPASQAAAADAGIERAPPPVDVTWLALVLLLGFLIVEPLLSAGVGLKSAVGTLKTIASGQRETTPPVNAA